MSEQIKTDKPDPAAEVPAKRLYESPQMNVLGRLRELTQGAKTAGTDGGASKARN